MTHKYELPAPEGIATASEDGSVEIARVWISNGDPAIMVRPAFDNPKDMGRMLAEVCWHFASAYEQRGFTAAQAREAMKAGWIDGHASGDAANRGNGPQ